MTLQNKELLTRENDYLKHLDEQKKFRMIQIADIPLYQDSLYRCDYTMFQEYGYEFFLRMINKINKNSKPKSTYHVFIVSHRNYLFNVFRELIKPTDILSQTLTFESIKSYYPLSDEYYLSYHKTNPILENAEQIFKVKDVSPETSSKYDVTYRKAIAMETAIQLFSI
jgi:hypothetical protein